MPDRRLILAVFVGVGLLVLVVALGVLQPPRKGDVISDRLGPEPGQQVATYLEQARSSLRGPDGERYALVSLTDYMTSAAAADLTDHVRVSQVIYRVPIPRVQTGLVSVDVPDGPAAVAASSGYAASRVQSDVLVPDSRAGRIAAVSSKRLSQGCACVVALTVRGTTAQLAALAQQPAVRAVEALPRDAVFGRFAVVPLLPEQVDVVAPGPDDGPVPDN